MLFTGSSHDIQPSIAGAFDQCRGSELSFPGLYKSCYSDVKLDV